MTKLFLVLTHSVEECFSNPWNYPAPTTKFESLAHNIAKWKYYEAYGSKS